MEEKYLWGVFVGTDEEARQYKWYIESLGSGPVEIEPVKLKKRIEIVWHSNMRFNTIFNNNM